MLRNALAMTLLLAASLPMISGCSSLACGDGTHGDGKECLPSLPPDCGSGTKLVDGTCVPDSSGGAVCGTGTHSENGTCVPNVNKSGNAARFYTADLTDPAAFVPLTNGSFHDSFVTGENLVFIGAYTPTTTTLRFFGGNGSLNADGSYTLDHTKAYDAPASMTGNMATSEPFTFKMKAFGAPQDIILVDTVISNGVVDSPEGVTLVQSGKLSGVITPENARNVYLQDANLSLYDLMLSLEIAPDVDRDGDGVKESWIMGMTFTTQPVWLL